MPAFTEKQLVALANGEVVDCDSSNVQAIQYVAAENVLIVGFGERPTGMPPIRSPLSHYEYAGVEAILPQDIARAESQGAAVSALLVKKVEGFRESNPKVEMRFVMARKMSEIFQQALNKAAADDKFFKIHDGIDSCTGNRFITLEIFS